MKNLMLTNFDMEKAFAADLSFEELYITDYIYSFAKSGKMVSKELYVPSLKKKLTFYWVGYGAMIRDLNGGFGKKGPFPITSTKYVGEMMKALAAKKVFFFQVVHSLDFGNGKDTRGNWTMFAINEEMKEFLTYKAEVKEGSTPALLNACPGEEKGRGYAEKDGDPLPKKPETNINILEDDKAISYILDSPSKEEEENEAEGETREGADGRIIFDNDWITRVRELSGSVLGLKSSMRINPKCIYNLLSSSLDFGIKKYRELKSYLEYVRDVVDEKEGIRDRTAYFLKAAADRASMDMYQATVRLEKQKKNKAGGRFIPGEGRPKAWYND